MSRNFQIIIYVLLSIGSSFGQRNELKLNAGKAAFVFPEICYENNLNRNMSISVSLGVGLDPKAYLGYKFNIIPAFRLYFPGASWKEYRNASGFFVETNIALYSQVLYDEGANYINYTLYPYSNSKTFTGLGNGLSTGYKYVSTGSWVIEGFIGLGYNYLAKKYSYNYNQFYPHFGILFGKRF